MTQEHAPPTKTFRIFVSSTFSDLKAERDALQRLQAPGDGSARDFIDQIEVDGRFGLDAAAHGRLARLKEDELRRLLTDHVDDYAATWNGTGINEDHLGSLPDSLDECPHLLHDPEATGTLFVDVWRAPAATILGQLEQVEQVDPLDAEIWSHQEFGRERGRHFTGREQPLAAVAEYLSAAQPCPFAVLGESGSGKSALMAKALQEARTGHPDAVTLVRFIGATPASSDARRMTAC
jgi:hypothetical protein